MGQQDNTRSQDRDIRRQPQQQEQATDKNAKKRDKTGQSGRQPGDEATEDERMSRH